MKCVVKQYFQNQNREWHQPGCAIDLDREAAEKYEEEGKVFIKNVRTRMLDLPLKRKRGRPRKTNVS